MSPWILHMSDPHLGNVSPGQPLDDQKVEFAGQPDLETTQKVFKRTLDRLAPVIAEHGKPDVAVVSGDLTYRTEPNGFDDFIKLLEAHDDVLPDRDRIIIVPGNHDVLWRETPGTKARYEPFLRATRDEGCITPLLDGVDFAADDERGKLFADVEIERHLIETTDMIVVPLNTSNWCGEFVDPRRGWKRADWEKALAPLGASCDEAIEQIDQLRQQDIARVSRAQIAALGRLFETFKLSRTPGEDVRIRVVVMHHQLLPVSTREERKPFESLLNLGEVRQMLAEYGFDVVLHGHKHESSLYWDAPSTDNEDLTARVQRMLVIASPGHFGPADPTMRALFFEGNHRARNLRVRTYLGAESSTRKLKTTEDQVVPLWDGQMAAEATERAVISATTAHVAYARLRAHFEGREDQQVRNLVCRVDDPGDAVLLPPDHPAHDFDDPERWFSELVAWWQQERSELVERGLIEFNHGERIRRRWGNQVERAIHQLNSRENSSRSLIVLIDPNETGRRPSDSRPLAEGGTYPAFALAEFSIRRIARNRRALDCFAYFRKQEMQYWWPVNLAEVALLQNAVLGGLRGSPARGRIVTFSAVALWKDVLPRVAVPEVTRLIEQPERLWTLASALAFPATANDQVRADWRVLLDDLVAVRDDPLLSRPGVEALRAELVRFQALPETAPLDAAVQAIDGLLEAYDLVGTQKSLSKKQRVRLDERHEALRDAVQILFGL